jgi:hypothetical protein
VLQGLTALGLGACSSSISSSSSSCSVARLVAFSVAAL